MSRAVILTDFPFTDLSSTKRRPALVISANNDRRSDVIVAYITSVLRDHADGAILGPTVKTD
ncbi:MAG TPA: type II toxin-antitoxin system PemK/MazF family toxin [Rhizomicrobium sp.]|nr:type II toxin-antitoxin system PemK/MazF family toxin [Rhizomicrobium sp.]